MQLSAAVPLAEQRLVVWSDVPTGRVLSAISPVIAGCHGLKVLVVDDVAKAPPGSTILVLGKGPTEALGLLGAIKKKASTASLRNRVTEKLGHKFLFSYHPAVQKVDYALYVDLLCDVQSAVRVAVTGRYKPDLGHYEYVQDFAQMIAEIKAEYAKTGKPVRICFDTETRGSDPFHPEARFVTWQFSHRHGYSAVRFFGSRADYEQALANGLREQAEWLFNSPMVSLRAANGKYDFVWVWVHGGFECTSFKLDSTLVGSLNDENRSNGLKVHAKLFTKVGGYEEALEAKYPDKSRMDLVPKGQDLLEYAGGDTDAGLQVSEVLQAQLLQNKPLTAFYVNLLHPAARAYEVIERGGIFVDKEEYQRLEADLITEIGGVVKAAKSILGGRLCAKHYDPTMIGGINLTKKSLLVDFLFTNAGLNLKPFKFTDTSKEPKTDFEHLQMFKDHPTAGPFVRLVEQYSEANKTLTTYVVGFKEHLRQDGKFHPSYFLFKGPNEHKKSSDKDAGTVTGRRSAKEPAIQTVPKHTKWGKRIRKVFNAPPGHLVCERDYSQGELRVVACIANEPTMIKAYQEGKDLHVLTGSKIAGMTYEAVLALEATDPARYEAIRQPGKPANFGLLYGMGAEGFQEYAANNYGVMLTLAEAEAFRAAFFALYRGLPIYHQTYKAYARKHGHVTSPLGRVRHLPFINSPDRGIQSGQERMAINSPVQSTLADMMAWAFAIEFAQGGMKEAPTFAEIHDAAYDYLPEDSWEKHAKRKKEIMENLPFHKLGWKPQLKFIADVKVGPDMATLKKVKLAA